jgi:pimeloyl-ACP methyl ester carboxylesterase
LTIHSALAVSPEFVREFVLGTIHHPVPEEFLERAVSESLKVPARVWRDYLAGVVLAVDDTARFHEIGAQTLILWGEEDALLPREEQEWRAAAIPNATLQVNPETGHLAHWVRPESVARDLQAFLKETAVAWFFLTDSSANFGEALSCRDCLSPVRAPNR